MNVVLAFAVTLVIIFVVPILVYGVFTALLGLKEPDKKLSFLLGVLIQKVGTAAGFVGLYYIGKESIGGDWLPYTLVWVVMYALTEIGQTMLPGYSKKEALAGIISELMYFPLAGAIVARMLG